MQFARVFRKVLIGKVHLPVSQRSVYVITSWNIISGYRGYKYIIYMEEIGEGGRQLSVKSSTFSEKQKIIVNLEHY